MGNYADVVVFDPATVADHATYEKPQQYATGITDVFVNGAQVLNNNVHTNATSGRYLKGPGYKRKSKGCVPLSSYVSQHKTNGRKQIHE